MASNTTTKVEIKGQDELSPVLKKISSSIDDMSKNSLTKMAVSFDAITQAAKTVTSAISKVWGEAKKLVDEFATVDRLNTRFTAVWGNVGTATGKSAKEMLNLADAIEKTTYFEAESIQAAAQTLAATQALSEDGFERALTLSVDLAEAMGTDVPSAASTLARALIAPEEGLSRLKTIGIAFTDEEKDLITELKEANKDFEAQEIVLDKVEEKYGGIAETVADIDANTLTQIGNSLGTIKENLGEAILNEIQPALEWVLKKLQKIENWSAGQAVNTAVKNNLDLSDYSDDLLLQAQKGYQRDIDLNMATQGYSNAEDRDSLEKINKEFEKREKLMKKQMIANRQSDGTSLESYTIADVDDYEGAGVGMTDEEMDAILSKYKEFEDKNTEVADNFVKTWGQASSAVSGLFTSVSDLITATYDQQADALEEEMEAAKEAGTLTIEEEQKKKDEINKIRKKSFEAEKANSIAQALISGAQAVVGFLADPGSWAGIALASVAGISTAAQVAAISQQSYTPMATGGIVSSPTHALVGEAGPEAIIPLTQGRNPLEDMAGCTINITIEGNADEEKIYQGIQMAQRTGALPHWSYT